MEPIADAEPLPALAAVMALEDLVRRCGQDPRAAIDQDADVVDVGVVDAAGDRLPAIAAIGAAPDTVDLDPSPDHAMIGRIDAERGDPRHPHVRAVLGHLGRQPLPAAPAVLRAEQRRRPRSGKDDVGIRGIDRDLPDMQLVHWRLESLEALPAIAALVDPVIGAGENRARLRRMYRQPEHLALAPQPLHDPAPVLAAVAAGPGAAADRADTDRVIARHGVPPGWFARTIRLPRLQRQGARNPQPGSASASGDAKP